MFNQRVLEGLAQREQQRERERKSGKRERAGQREPASSVSICVVPGNARKTTKGKRKIAVNTVRKRHSGVGARRGGRVIEIAEVGSSRVENGGRTCVEIIIIICFHCCSLFV